MHPRPAQPHFFGPYDDDFDPFDDEDAVVLITFG